MKRSTGSAFVLAAPVRVISGQTGSARSNVVHIACPVLDTFSSSVGGTAIWSVHRHIMAEPVYRESEVLTLSDGRKLGYCEHGAATGKPLLLFHGFPSCRLEVTILHSLFLRHGIRAFGLDRPGFGLSTFQPGRQITYWPRDVEEFADKMGLDRFAILGISGGGPYALACALELPQESLTGVGILAGATLWDKGLRTPDLMWWAKAAYILGNYLPTTYRLISAGVVYIVRWGLGIKRVGRAIDAFIEKEKEKEKISHPERHQDHVPIEEARRLIIQSILEPFRQGTAGLVQEHQLITLDWNIPFRDIRYPDIRFWHGTEDVNAPFAGIKFIANQVEGHKFTQYKTNHHRIGEHIDEVLDELMGEDKADDDDGSEI